MDVPSCVFDRVRVRPQRLKPVTFSGVTARVNSCPSRSCFPSEFRASFALVPFPFVLSLESFLQSFAVMSFSSVLLRVFPHLVPSRSTFLQTPRSGRARTGRVRLPVVPLSAHTDRGLSRWGTRIQRGPRKRRRIPILALVRDQSRYHRIFPAGEIARGPVPATTSHHERPAESLSAGVIPTEPVSYAMTELSMPAFLEDVNRVELQPR